MRLQGLRLGQILFRVPVSLAFVLVFLVCGARPLVAAGPLVSVLSTNGQVRLSWLVTNGLSYQIDSTPRIDPFSLWSPVGASITLNGGAASASIGATSNYQFFRVAFLPNTGLPTARFISPASGETVSGVVQIEVGATDDRKVQSVTLWIDGAPWATLTNGDTVFPVQTKHFTNGTHSIQVTVQDNAGDEGASATVSANEAIAGPLLLNFQNSLRWPDGDIGFTDGYEIVAESDVFPASFTVYVEDEVGSSVRILTGQTTDGIVSTCWDGLDANGNVVPDQTGYSVTIVREDAPAMLSRTASAEAVDAKPFANRYGLTDYEVTVNRPSLREALSALLPPGLRETMRGASLRQEKEKPMAHRLSARRARQLMQADSSGPQLLSDISSPSSVTRTPYKQPTITSGQAILARQRFGSSLAGVSFNSVVASHLVNIQNLVAAAETDPAMPNGRGRTPGSIHECNTSANWRSLVNEITNATFNATHFYYFGHGGPKGIGFSENTPKDGILSDEIALGLRNGRRPFVDADGNLRFSINRPYRFVFLNGCNTANGLLAESFGIPAILKKSLPLSQRRLFLGWKTTQYNSIANNAHIQFSQRFWNEWLPVGGPYDQTSASAAVDVAAAAYPGVSTNSLARFGDQSLKWQE